MPKQLSVTVLALSDLADSVTKEEQRRSGDSMVTQYEEQDVDSG